MKRQAALKQIAGILALIPAIAFAQARIEGRVVDTAGEPIARASLRLNNTMPSEILLTELPVPGFAAESSDDGSFVIENIEPGRGYHLAARRPGFVSGLFGATPATPGGTAIDVVDGQIVQGVLLVLTQQAVITGRITDANGDPVVNARVAAWSERFVRGERQLYRVPNANAVANDRGEYRLAGLRPGRVRIAVTGSLIPQPGATGRNEPTFFPNAADPKDARIFDLKRGDQLSGIDVQLRSTPVFNIRGKVVDASGKPVPGTILHARPAVTLSPLDEPQARTIVRNADGTFEIRGVPPGRHSVETMLGVIVVNPNVKVAPYIGSVDVTVTDRDLEGVVLTVAPGAVVNGRIAYPDGSIAETLASAPPLPVPRSIALMPESPAAATSFPLQPDGSFHKEGLAFAPHTLRQDVLPDTVYIRSVLFNGSDVTHSPIDLTDGGGDLEIILSGNPADISGIVEGARTGPLVALWPEQPNRNDYDDGLRTLTTDQNGAFRFGGLAPGVYLVAAWDGAEEGLLLNDAFRSKFTDSALRLDIAEGASLTVEPPVIPATRVAEEAEKLP